MFGEPSRHVVLDRRLRRRASPMPFHVVPLAPSRTDLCPGDGLKKICSGTYIVTQADVDTGERNNTASVTYESPDKRRIESAQSNTVAVTGSSAVSIGEARFH